jgi:hypothetical protein
VQEVVFGIDLILRDFTPNVDLNPGKSGLWITLVFEQSGLWVRLDSGVTRI